MAAKTNCIKNGIRYFRLSVTVGKDGEGKSVRKEFYGKSKTEAETKRDEYLEGIKKGLAISYNKIKLGDFLHTWLFDVLRLSEMKPSTFDRYEGLYRNYIKHSWLNNILVCETRSIIIQRYYNECYEAGISSKTIRTIHKLLRYFFNYCIAEDYLIKNPCFKLTIPGTIEEKKSKEMDPFQDEEVIAIKQALKNNNIETAVLLCFGTGLREGELLGLSFDDVDLDIGELYVRKTLKRVKIINKDGKHKYMRLLQEPKTKESCRVIPIPSAIIKQLKSHIAKQKEKLIRNGIPYSPDKLLFTTDSLGFIDDRNLLRAWQRVLKKANIRYRNFHTIRHTYATKLFENGIPLKTVSILLGHSDIKITANIYTHVMPREKEKAAETLNHLLL